MAELKMVTEGELRSNGYEVMSTGISISDDYCPTVDIFMDNWRKSGFLIEGIVGKENNQLFALSEISEKVKLILFDESIVFDGGYGDAAPTDGFYMSASTSLTSFTIEFYYDEYCNNKVDVSWGFNLDGTNDTFTQNGIIYRAIICTGGLPYNDTDSERFLYIKITGEGNGLSETDIFKVKQLNYNDVYPTWDIDYIDFNYNDGPSSTGQFNIFDEANYGWILECPDFMTASPTGGTGESVITYYPKSANDSTTARYGTLYLRSKDGITEYQNCSVVQHAKPISSMIISFNGMNTDPSFGNDTYKYLYVWDNYSILIKLGNDFNPLASQKSVTITKELITKIENSSSSYKNVTTADDWKIICSDVSNAESSDAAGFVIMANYVDVKSVMDTIVNTWKNNNDSVTITVSYSGDISLTPPSWDLTTGSTLGISYNGKNITFTVTDEDSAGYILSASNATSFLYLIDPSSGTKDWGIQTGGTQQWRLDILNNTGSARYGYVYLMDSNDKTILNNVQVQQLAYVDTSMGELYSIRSNGSNNYVVKLMNDISQSQIMNNDITIDIEWAPLKTVLNDTNIIPIFGYSATNETYIYAEYVPDNLNYNYRIHVVSAGLDISGCTFMATNTSSENLVQIKHFLYGSGKNHQVVVAIPNSSGFYTQQQFFATGTTVPTYYSIRAGGVSNYWNKIKMDSYYGRVNITIGSDSTNWVPYTTNGTTVGWVQKTDSGDIESNTFVTASNYSIGKKK